jgi:hypothetical protein
MMMNDDERGAIGGCLTGETEVLGENLSQCNFVHHKSHITGSRLEPGLPRWKAGD